MGVYLSNLIENIFEEFCDHYCKKPDEYKKEHGLLELDDFAADDFSNTVCINCPVCSKYCAVKEDSDENN